MIRIIINLLVCTVLFIGCNIDEEKPCEIATVEWGGNPAVDGCGWMIKIENESYLPESLAEEFQEDNLEICITYESIDSLYCGFAKMAAIRINEIE